MRTSNDLPHPTAAASLPSQQAPNGCRSVTRHVTRRTRFASNREPMCLAAILCWRRQRSPFRRNAASATNWAATAFHPLLFRLLLCLCFFDGWWTTRSVWADDFSLRSPFARQLTAPMTSVLDGKTFRSGLESLANESGLNLWLDRHVDPSAPIECGPVGPTVYGALAQLAKSRDCAVMPVANVVLVGRAAWVDRTATAILSISPSKRGEVIDIAWPELTTPQEALRLVLGPTSTEAKNPTLPHDHWPAVRWQKIQRQVAVRLIESQFEEASEAPRPAAEAPMLTRRYAKENLSPAELRQAMRDVDPDSQIRVSGDWIVSKATIQAHRAATTSVLAAAGKQAGPDLDRDTFTLKKMTTSAENAFRQLAQAAQRRCVIEPEAVEACQTMVAIEGVDLTLRQLIEMVATQAGVDVGWQDESVVVSAKR